MPGESYECSEPPCIHLARMGRLYAVFVETSDGDVIYVPAERLREACRRLEELEERGLREAQGDEIDRIAERVLGAEPVGEEE